MITLLKKQRASSVMGLTLDGNRLEAVVLRRVNGGMQVQQTLNSSLALSPLTGDSELVGREIRNHLEGAGIRERRCVVCLPLSWVLTLQTAVPDMPEADVASFLEIEAERGFSSGVDGLFVTHSLCRWGEGKQSATLMAVPRNHLLALGAALKAAQLRPMGFALGVAELQKAGKEEGVLTLAAGESGVDLLLTSGGGIAAVRSLDGAVEKERVEKWVDADLIGREIRITLGQLPDGLSAPVKKIRIFGRGEAAEQLGVEMMPKAKSLGLEVEVMKRASAAHFDKPLPSEIALSTSLAAAANWLGGSALVPNFMPPRVQPWKQLLAARFSSKKLAWAGAVVGGLVLCIGGAFLFQQWQIMRLESQWKEMEPRVAAVENAQQQVKKYRPWFDESFRSLRILRKLSEVFPEDGVVSVKTLEMHDLSTITCTGVARDKRSLLKLHDQLRAAKEVSDLKIDNVRGQGPLQFTFNFQWEGVKPSGN